MSDREREVLDVGDGHVFIIGEDKKSCAVCNRSRPYVTIDGVCMECIGTKNPRWYNGSGSLGLGARVSGVVLKVLEKEIGKAKLIRSVG